MCLTCGCGEPMESHGNADNITANDMERAAGAADITLGEAAKNMFEGLREMGVAEGPGGQGWMSGRPTEGNMPRSSDMGGTGAIGGSDETPDTEAGGEMRRAG